MKLGQVTGAPIVDHTKQEYLLTPHPQSPATAANLSVECQVMQQSTEVLNVFSVTTSTCTGGEHVKWRQQQLGKVLRGTKGQLSEGDHLPLEKITFEYHDVFSLEDE